MAPFDPKLSILAHFADLEDPRLDRRRLHELQDIIAIAILAVLAGAEGFEAIAVFGVAKRSWLQTFLALPHGIPSHDTFRRVLGLVRPDKFLECFRRWVDDLTDVLRCRRIIIDGKTLRRSFDRKNGKNALHLVSAWSSELRVVLGQVAVDAKSNEITAIPELLEMLDISGAMVTIDAMGCQKEIAATIRAGEGHYCLAVKDNQPRLLEDIEASFLKASQTKGKGMKYSQVTEVNEGHGRKEERTICTIVRPEGIRDADLWKDLKAITMVASTCQRGDEEPSHELRYYVGSRAVGARTYANAIRGHWDIENGLHWVLDVSFDEDQSRIRTDHGPENFALLRRLALSLLKQKGKGSVRSKRLRCGWNEEFLAELLTGK